MKFGTHLDAYMFDEWRKYYLRYRSIKDHIEELFPTKKEIDQKAIEREGRLKWMVKECWRSVSSKFRGQQKASPNNGPIHNDAQDQEKLLPPSSSDLFLNRSYGSINDSRSTSSSFDHSNSSDSLSSSTSFDSFLTSPSPSPTDADVKLKQEVIKDLACGFATLSAQERTDQVLTKLLGELQKIDAFYSAMEEEIILGFQSLKSQVDHIVNPLSHDDQPLPLSASNSQSNLHGLIHKRHPHKNTTDDTPSPLGKHENVFFSNNTSATHDLDIPQLKDHRYNSDPTSSQRSHDIDDDRHLHSPSDGRSNGAISVKLDVFKPKPLSMNHSSSPSPSPSPHSPTPSPSSSSDHPHSHSNLNSHLRAPPHPARLPSLNKRQSVHGLPANLVSLEDVEDSPLKNSFVYILRRETMLVHFVDINMLAFKKVLKNLEKRSHVEGIADKFMSVVKKRHFAKSHVIVEELIPQTYQLFADCFEHGRLESAKVAMLNRMNQKHERKSLFLLGLKIGVLVMLLLWNIMSLLRPLPDSHLEILSMFGPVYRAIGFLLCWIWFWGVTVLFFDSFRISYVYIFQLDPRTRLTHFQIFNEAANITIVYLVNTLLLISHYERALGRHISAIVYPLAMLLYVLLKLFAPFRLFSHWESRRTLLDSLFNVIIAPFGKIRFREGYVGDVLTSMVKIFVDIYACILLYSNGQWLHNIYQNTNPSDAPTITGTISPTQSAAHGNGKDDIVSFYAIPIICAIPLWWRFQQCLRAYYDTGKRWPHLGNALKYALSHSVVIVWKFHPSFSGNHGDASQWHAFRIVWVTSFICSSIYLFVWDVTMDWGLFSFDPQSKHKLLRSTLLYKHSCFYYWAIVSDFFLRFAWSVTIIPFSLRGYNLQKVSDQPLIKLLFSYDYAILPAIAFVEIFRRFQWTLFRVEWEQLNKGSGFRMGEYIPAFFQTQTIQQAGQIKTVEKADLTVIAEVFLMIFLLVVIAILGAIL